MLTDFGPEIADCGRELLLIRRPRAKLVRGRKRAQPELSGVPFVGSLQNPRDQDLQELPEGQRRDGVRSLYTAHRLVMGEVGDDYETDQIHDPVGDLRYEVFADRDWCAEGRFYRYLLRKVGQ